MLRTVAHGSGRLERLGLAAHWRARSHTAFGANRLKVADNLVVLEIMEQVDLGLYGLKVPRLHVACWNFFDGPEVARLPIECTVDLP